MAWPNFRWVKTPIHMLKRMFWVFNNLHPWPNMAIEYNNYMASKSSNSCYNSYLCKWFLNISSYIQLNSCFIISCLLPIASNSYWELFFSQLFSPVVSWWTLSWSLVEGSGSRWQGPARGPVVVPLWLWSGPGERGWGLDGWHLSGTILSSKLK